MSQKTTEQAGNTLDRIVQPLAVIIGLLIVLHGVLRLAGVIPPEPAPGWAFVTIGLLMIAEVTIRD